MSGDEEGEKRKKKYNSLSKYAGEWKQTYGIEKDLVNLHLDLHRLYEVEGYQSTACPTVLDINSNTGLHKIQPQALYESPEKVKAMDKDVAKDGGAECVTGGIDACCVVTGPGFKNCLDTVLEEREDNGRHHNPTREEKLEALWSSRIKENANVIRDRVHSSPALPLVCQLTNTLRQTLLLCSVSEKTCQRPLLHVNNESDLAVIILKDIKELACKNDQSAIDKFQHILKESLAICNEKMEEGGEDGEESSYDVVQFLKALLDMVACMGRERNNDMNELTFDKYCNNYRNRRPALFDDNVFHKTNNVEILKLINLEIIEIASEKKGREELTALQLEFKKETHGILSTIAIKRELLKEKEILPHQVYKTEVATTSATSASETVYEREEQGKKRKKMKLSRVTKEIRARMKRRTELERQEWTEDES